MKAQLVSVGLLERRRRRSRRWLIAGLVGVTLLLGLGVLWWVDPAQWHVPLCGLYRTTGYYCPGCGATRATHHLLHGRLLKALDENALWVLSLPLVLYGAASEVRRAWCGRPLPGDIVRQKWLIFGFAAVALVFGLLRNLPGEPFEWLAP